MITCRTSDSGLTFIMLGHDYQSCYAAKISMANPGQKHMESAQRIMLCWSDVKDFSTLTVLILDD